MILRNFDLFKKCINYDPSSRIIVRSYESDQDEAIDGVYKELSVGKVFFYRLDDQLYVELKENRYHINDIKQYKEKGGESILLLENSTGSIELREPLQMEVLDDPFTMISDDDFKFLKYIENMRLKVAKRGLGVLFNYK